MAGGCVGIGAFSGAIDFYMEGKSPSPPGCLLVVGVRVCVCVRVWRSDDGLQEHEHEAIRLVRRRRR